jgi:hypothetical protein
MAAAVSPLAAIALLLTGPGSLFAQTLPDSVRPGVKVEIVDEAGGSVEGRLQEVSAQGVRLSTRRGITDVPVETIVRIARPDGIKNGALIGLAVGVGLGIVGASNYAEGDTAVLVSQTLGNGLVCAGIGALLDAAVDTRRTLYQRGPRRQTRVMPLIGPGAGGLAASITW